MEQQVLELVAWMGHLKILHGRLLILSMQVHLFGQLLVLF